MEAGGRGSSAETYYQIEAASIISTETQVSISSKPFTVYRVEVVPVAATPWVVAKRFSEFGDLRAALVAIDKKGQQVLAKQPFPPKHLYGSMQEEVVAARLETLQAWLGAVVQHYKNAVPLLTFLADDGSENSAVDLLGAKSYLRGVELQLDKPMTGWGTRTPKEKSSYLLSTKPQAVTAGPKRQVLTMLTLSHPPLPGPCPVPVSSKSNRGHMRSFLTDVEHPFLMPVVDIGFQVENDKMLVFREFASRGSLKDLVYKAKTPCVSMEDKYEVAAAIKRRTGLNEKKVALYGRQILEGMRYLEELGLACSSLSCANVLVYENDWCRISDYENALVGLSVRHPGGTREQQIDGSGADSQEGATAQLTDQVGGRTRGMAPSIVFGRLLHELATGVEIPAGVVEGSGEAFRMPACPIQIQRVLDMIFNTSTEDGSVVNDARMAGGAGGGGSSVQALLEIPFFNGVELHPRHQEGCIPPLEKTRKLKKRLGKCLAPPKEKKKSRSKRDLVRAGAEVDAADEPVKTVEDRQYAQAQLPPSQQAVTPEPEPEPVESGLPELQPARSGLLDAIRCELDPSTVAVSTCFSSALSEVCVHSRLTHCVWCARAGTDLTYKED
eukprot:COSAG02_NODE_6372_length_3617_cov_2.744457_2_plen_612_part_00